MTSMMTSLSDMAKQLTQKAAVAKPVENKLAERDWVPVWYVGGIMLVPHYSQKYTWVWPGGEPFNPSEILNMGGKESTTLLWPRHWL
jgi:hypothetical protein